MAARSLQRQQQTVLPPEDLRLLRAKRGHSFRTLAPKVGVSPSTWCLMETGRRPIPPALAVKLFRVLMIGDG